MYDKSPSSLCGGCVSGNYTTALRKTAEHAGCVCDSTHVINLAISNANGLIYHHGLEWYKYQKEQQD